MEHKVTSVTCLDSYCKEVREIPRVKPKQITTRTFHLLMFKSGSNLTQKVDFAASTQTGGYLSFVVIYHMPCPFWNTYKLTQHLLKTGIMVSFNKRYQKHMKDIKSINWIQLISMSILLPNSVSFPFHNHPIKLQWWGIAIARPHASSKQVGHWQLCPWPNPWRQERFKARKVRRIPWNRGTLGPFLKKKTQCRSDLCGQTVIEW